MTEGMFMATLNAISRVKDRMKVTLPLMLESYGLQIDSEERIEKMVEYWGDKYIDWLTGSNDLSSLAAAVFRLEDEHLTVVMNRFLLQLYLESVIIEYMKKGVIEGGE